MSYKLWQRTEQVLNLITFFLVYGLCAQNNFRKLLCFNGESEARGNRWLALSVCVSARAVLDVLLVMSIYFIINGIALHTTQAKEHIVHTHTNTNKN